MRVIIYKMLRISLGFAVSTAGVFGVVSNAHANTGVPLAPIRLKVEPQDRIFIKGYRGRVEYFAKDNLTDIVVTVHEVERANAGAIKKATKIFGSDDWQVTVKRENNTIIMSIDGPTSKQTWSELLVGGNMSPEVPEFVISATGPSRPLEVSWHDGPIKIENLASELRVTSVKSNIEIAQGHGDATVSLQEGELDIKNRKGPLYIESYNAKVNILGSDGPVRLENFAGDTNLHGADGSVDFMSYKGAAKLAAIKGRLEFKNGVGAIHIEKFEGELRGQSAQGAVTAEILGDADVRLQSVEGAVNLHLPSSGAWVNLVTTDGQMTVPSYLKPTRLPTQIVRSGKLKGSASGSIYVRTTSGEIRIH